MKVILQHLISELRTEVWQRRSKEKSGVLGSEIIQTRLLVDISNDKARGSDRRSNNRIQKVAEYF